MEPYRGPKGGSSTLAALAAEGNEAIPRQSKLLTPEQMRERLELAAGVEDQQAGAGYVILALLSSLVFFAPCVASLDSRLDPPDGAYVAMVIGLVATLAFGLAAARLGAEAKRIRGAAVARMLEWPATLPFPADGYEEHLVADQPLVDVVVAVPPERRMFVDAAKAVDPAIDVEPIGDRRFRLALPPRSKTFTSKHSARLVRFGDREVLGRLFERMIVPLHTESGVEAVHFGGTIEVRN
jgi:hypothetical protein